MKNKTVIISAAAGTFLIGLTGGCEKSPRPEETRPVAWWEANAAERTAKLEECTSQPKYIDATPNCKNASLAENSVRAAAKWGTEKDGVRTEPQFPPYP
jgi:hypothetical protein